MEWIILIIVLVTAGCILLYYKNKKTEAHQPFPTAWKLILDQKVDYYHHLPADQKQVFEDDVIRFFKQVKIEGVKTEVDITDKLLVASSAVIPVLGFPEWQYHFLKYVILYPGAFDRNFKFDNASEYITGMVGSGIMEGRVILSKSSLHLGFSNARDKKNVGIHEFIHLLDKQDGVIDEIPTFLNTHEYVLPWLELIRKETDKIMKGENSDINPYGATAQEEFLTVTGEYFFERPHLLEKNHPELFRLLSKAFNQDPGKILPAADKGRPQMQRNSPCICGSGKKFKHCCLKK